MISNAVQETRRAVSILLQTQSSLFQASPNLTILFAVSGRPAVSVNVTGYSLRFGGLLCINPFQHFSVTCHKGDSIAVLKISEQILRLSGWQLSQGVSFFIADHSPGRNDMADQMRCLFARIFENYFQLTPSTSSDLVSDASRLIGLLEQLIPAEQRTNPAKTGISPSARDHFSRILQYIHNHWQEPLSVSLLAKQEYISTGYLAKLFGELTGTTAMRYLAEVRMEHALEDLLHSDKSVTDIAYQNGFKNVNSFIRYFKSLYHDTPMQYRRRAQLHAETDSPSVPPELPARTGINELLAYAAMDQSGHTASALPEEFCVIEADAARAGKCCPHTYQRLLNIGYAADGLKSEVREQLRTAHDTIGFSYVRFHGIFDDDMYLYREDTNGQPHLDFSRCDLLLDMILSLEMKPYIELGYMPRPLSAEPFQPFDRSSCISMYRNESNWIFLVSGFVRHCLERYGTDEVCTWRFTTIAGAFVSVQLLKESDFLRLYRTTRNAVKEVNPLIPFGGPGTQSNADGELEFADRFFRFAAQNDCLPDFISIRCYPHSSLAQDPEFLQYSLSQASVPSVLSGDMHYTRTMLQEYQAILRRFDMEDAELWLDEWNSTLWQRDLSGDTCYKAAWLVHNYCETASLASAFGYWTLSDFIDERADFGAIFHGGYGLMTYNGIPKSGWQALRLISALGTHCIASGPDWIAAKGEHSIQILLTHYCHYDTLYRLRYQRLTDPREAYKVFINRGNRRCRIRLTGLQAGIYDVTTTEISRMYGSSYDIWLNMGAPAELYPHELSYLRQMSQPAYHIESIRSDGTYTTELIAAPHSVYLLELKFRNAVH
ncbi:MAG: helix-turn-helix domain-containing protein [Eubacterium sp.]|nr:helix-turn-helix domain-containing protein [Eubacterium sp.]